MRLWDVESGHPLIVLRGHSDEIWGAAFSRDGKSVATAGRDKTIRLGDVEFFHASKTIFTASTTKTGPVSISPNGQFVAGWGETTGDFNGGRLCLCHRTPTAGFDLHQSTSDPDAIDYEERFGAGGQRFCRSGTDKT